MYYVQHLYSLSVIIQLLKFQQKITNHLNIVPSTDHNIILSCRHTVKLSQLSTKLSTNYSHNLFPGRLLCFCVHKNYWSQYISTYSIQDNIFIISTKYKRILKKSILIYSQVPCTGFLNAQKFSCLRVKNLLTDNMT